MNDRFLHACRLVAPGRRFPSGSTTIVADGHAANHHGLDPMMDFSILRLRARQRHREVTEKETVFLLLGGDAQIALRGKTHRVRRTSLFDEGPTVVHAARGEKLDVRSTDRESEWAVIRTENQRLRGIRLFAGDRFTSENRGAGLVQGTCERIVRTVFDHATQPRSNLVLGEVVNLPGRWSSYPPHHHPQPEIYHYRFTLAQGYGHAELGDAVFKVGHGDTMLIPGGLDHAQVSAPGYGMYYLWVVRHLPQRPYKGFTFTAAHTWLLDPRKQGWQPGRRTLRRATRTTG